MPEYKIACNSGKIPKDIPVNPNVKCIKTKVGYALVIGLVLEISDNSEKSKSFLSAKEAKPVLQKCCLKNMEYQKWLT